MSPVRSTKFNMENKMTAKKIVTKKPFLEEYLYYNEYILTDMQGCMINLLSLEEVQENIEVSWGEQDGLYVIYKGKIYSVSIEKKLLLKEIK